MPMDGGENTGRNKMQVEEFDEIKKRHDLDSFLSQFKNSDNPVHAAAYAAHQHRGILIYELELMHAKKVI